MSNPNRCLGTEAFILLRASYSPPGHRVSTTIERSRFLRDPASGGQWLFADYTLIDYPTWMEEAKQAELRARGEAGAGAGAGGSA